MPVDLLIHNYNTTAALCQHLQAARKEPLSPLACLLVWLYVSVMLMGNIFSASLILSLSEMQYHRGWKGGMGLVIAQKCTGAPNKPVGLSKFVSKMAEFHRLMTSSATHP